MPYTNEFGSHSNWSSVLDGFVQLVQLATAAASAKVLQDPEARAALHRGYIIPYAADPDVRHRSYSRFSQRLEMISGEYRELNASFQSIHAALRYTRLEANDVRWERARELNLPHDCVEFDRIRQTITYHLTQCAILHAQMVCSVTEYLENIHTAFICPPNYCDPGIPPFGPPPQYDDKLAGSAYGDGTQQPDQDTKDDQPPTVTGARRAPRSAE